MAAGQPDGLLGTTLAIRSGTPINGDYHPFSIYDMLDNRTDCGRQALANLVESKDHQYHDPPDFLQRNKPIVIGNVRLHPPMIWEIYNIYKLGLMRRQILTNGTYEEFCVVAKYYLLAKYAWRGADATQLEDMLSSRDMKELRSLVSDVYPVRPGWDGFDEPETPNNRHLLISVIEQDRVGPKFHELHIQDGARQLAPCGWDTTGEVTQWDDFSTGLMTRILDDGQPIHIEYYPPSSAPNKRVNGNYVRPKTVIWHGAAVDGTGQLPPNYLQPENDPPPLDQGPIDSPFRRPHETGLPGIRYERHPHAEPSNDVTFLVWTSEQIDIGALDTPSFTVVWENHKRPLRGSYIGLFDTPITDGQKPIPVFTKGSARGLAGVSYCGFPAYAWANEGNTQVRIKNNQGTYTDAACFTLTAQEKNEAAVEANYRTNEYDHMLRIKRSNQARQFLEEHTSTQVFREESHTHLLNQQLQYGDMMPPFRFDKTQLGKERESYLKLSHSLSKLTNGTRALPKAMAPFVQGLHAEFKRAYPDYQSSLATFYAHLQHAIGAVIIKVGGHDWSKGWVRTGIELVPNTSLDEYIFKHAFFHPEEHPGATFTGWFLNAGQRYHFDDLGLVRFDKVTTLIDQEWYLLYNSAYRKVADMARHTPATPAAGTEDAAESEQGDSMVVMDGAVSDATDLNIRNILRTKLSSNQLVADINALGSNQRTMAFLPKAIPRVYYGTKFNSLPLSDEIIFQLCQMAGPSINNYLQLQLKRVGAEDSAENVRALVKWCTPLANLIVRKTCPHKPQALASLNLNDNAAPYANWNRCKVLEATYILEQLPLEARNELALKSDAWISHQKEQRVTNAHTQDEISYLFYHPSEANHYRAIPSDASEVRVVQDDQSTVPFSQAGVSATQGGTHQGRSHNTRQFTRQQQNTVKKTPRSLRSSSGGTAGLPSRPEGGFGVGSLDPSPDNYISPGRSSIADTPRNPFSTPIMSSTLMSGGLDSSPPPSGTKGVGDRLAQLRLQQGGTLGRVPVARNREYGPFLQPTMEEAKWLIDAARASKPTVFQQVTELSYRLGVSAANSFPTPEDVMKSGSFEFVNALAAEFGVEGSQQAPIKIPDQEDQPSPSKRGRFMPTVQSPTKPPASGRRLRGPFGTHTTPANPFTSNPASQRFGEANPYSATYSPSWKMKEEGNVPQSSFGGGPRVDQKVQAGLGRWRQRLLNNPDLGRTIYEDPHLANLKAVMESTETTEDFLLAEGNLSTALVDKHI